MAGRYPRGVKAATPRRVLKGGGHAYVRGVSRERRVVHLHKDAGACFSQRFAGSHSMWDGVSYFDLLGTVYWQSKVEDRPTPAEMDEMVAFAEKCADHCWFLLFRRGHILPEIHQLVGRFDPNNNAVQSLLDKIGVLVSS